MTLEVVCCGVSRRSSSIKLVAGRGVGAWTSFQAVSDLGKDNFQLITGYGEELNEFRYLNSS